MEQFRKGGHLSDFFLMTRETLKNVRAQMVKRIKAQFKNEGVEPVSLLKNIELG